MPGGIQTACRYRRIGQIPKGLVLLILSIIGLFIGASAGSAETDIGELSRLLVVHHPQEPFANDSEEILDRFELRLPVEEGSEPTWFVILGFEHYGCGECHDANQMAELAADRMKAVMKKIRQTLPTVPPIPLRQYIIQPYFDELLGARQFAHATFDTIRLFPATIVIDHRVFDNATQMHEVLHLAQSFTGHVNELEAYGLNARLDPRYLLLNFPYFANVVTAYFVEDLDDILRKFYDRPINEKLSVSREVQWFMMPFDDEALKRLQEAMRKLAPLLEEVSRLNEEYPLEVAYLSEQTGIRSLILDLAAVKLLDLPPLEMPEDVQKKGFSALSEQMGKTDNTRLGYIIDRQQEASMFMRHQLKVRDHVQRLRLYFRYLKENYIGAGGEIDLTPNDTEDFHNYVKNKLEKIKKMVQFKGMSSIEKEAGTRTINAIKEKLPGP